MDAAELRDLIGELLLELDDVAYNRALSGIIDRAAHAGSGWAPPGPSADAVARIVAFADAARRKGYAEPAEVDDGLREGSNAFLGRDYAAAAAIFGALLPSLGNGEIHIGQHEMVDEVLGNGRGDAVRSSTLSPGT